MGFRVELKSREDLVQVMKMLQPLNVLGEDTALGTYLPNTHPSTIDIINNKVDLYRKSSSRPDLVCSVSITVEYVYIREKFPHIFGDYDVCVSLCTWSDHKEKNIPKRVVNINNVVEETMKLIVESTNIVLDN